jgi:hypothetical protein
MKSFKGIKLPFGKSSSKFWYFQAQDGKWLMRTKTRIIHKFETKQGGIDWWKEFGEFRGKPECKLKFSEPIIPGAKTARMGNISSSAPKSVCKICNGANSACSRCSGSGWV